MAVHRLESADESVMVSRSQLHPTATKLNPERCVRNPWVGCIEAAVYRLEMRFALVDGVRREPLGKGEHAECPGCGKGLLAKAGEIRTWHWAHQSGGDCDSWHDPRNEGPWHRAWKGLVVPEAQEVTLKRDDQHHRADVVGNNGRVIEFQHSPLAPEM